MLSQRLRTNLLIGILPGSSERLYNVFWISLSDRYRLRVPLPFEYLPVSEHKFHHVPHESCSVIHASRSEGAPLMLHVKSFFN